MRQRGYTLLEIVVTVGIVAMLVVAGGAFAQSMHPYAMPAAVQRLGSLLAMARSVAASSGNGATLTLTRSGTQTLITLYAGRPDGGTFGPVVTTDTLDAEVTSAAVAGDTFALFVDSGGTGTAAVWTAAQGTLATEPACPGALDLTVAINGGHQTHALSCSDMVLQ